MPNIEKIDQWDWEQGAPKLVEAPETLPTLLANNDYLCLHSKRVLKLHGLAKKCGDYWWGVTNLLGGLFDGRYEFVYKKWPAANVYELVWPQPPKPKGKKCPDCKGTGEYVGAIFVDTCQLCKGEKYVEDISM